MTTGHQTPTYRGRIGEKANEINAQPLAIVEGKSMTPKDVADLLKAQRAANYAKCMQGMTRAQREDYAARNIQPSDREAVKAAWSERKACSLCGGEGHRAKDCKWTEGGKT
jgi:hypothetical protein